MRTRVKLPIKEAGSQDHWQINPSMMAAWSHLPEGPDAGSSEVRRTRFIHKNFKAGLDLEKVKI